MRWTVPMTMMVLAACSGGTEDKAATIPEDTVSGSSAPETPPPALADHSTYTPDPAMKAPAAIEPDIGTGDRAIPATIRGRWGLVAADCTSTKGDAKGLLTIDAANLRFYESHGQLARIRERSDDHLVADYKFTGEGMEWDRLMRLGVEDGGKTLLRRDWGEGADAVPLRYIRCSEQAM